MSVTSRGLHRSTFKHVIQQMWKMSFPDPDLTCWNTLCLPGRNQDLLMLLAKPTSNICETDSCGIFLGGVSTPPCPFLHLAAALCRVDCLEFEFGLFRKHRQGESFVASRHCEWFQQKIISQFTCNSYAPAVRSDISGRLVFAKTRK